ncbi:hypothetical protein GALMADRAFT_144666 [Galerina marginata CBS 339.88]|uniref:Tetraspanin Tsp2 n=1 Tax=Galerina marginata (strain CBS 339.88) TaxID=685588 RepID=A0A067SK29_GALM3|nr:hypothetical protein GALMADRAFT_144666 [Galerina marginata CBS 339.88]
MQFDPPKPRFTRPKQRPDSSSSTLLHSSGSPPGFASPTSPFSSPSRSRDVSPGRAPPHALALANAYETPGQHHGLATGDSSASLSVNYVPSKFSNPLLSSPAGPRRRMTRGGAASARLKDPLNPGAGMVPKMGGGVDAFRSGEARIGGPADEDDEDDDELRDGDELFGRGRRGSKHAPRKLRWNRFKWVLFAANLLLTIYSFTTLILTLLTWFNIFPHAAILRSGNTAELVLSTLAACTGILVSLLGWAGLLTNNRSFLAVYTLLLWVVFAFILVPGYLTYKRRTFNLEGKINLQWSKHLGEDGRLTIQNELQCCGYFSPFVEATVSQTCYARSILPGCKARYLAFERKVLRVWYGVAFGLVPLHLAVMVAGLLCANHVTYRFGKGMMPKAYRLSVASMAVIMDNYAGQLAEQYGDEIAADVLTRSRSNLNLQLEALPSVPYAPSGPAAGAADAGVYEGRTRESRSHERSREGRSHEGRSHEGRSHEGRSHEGRSHESRSHESRSHEGRTEARSYQARSRSHEARAHDDRGHEGRSYEPRTPGPETRTHGGRGVRYDKLSTRVPFAESEQGAGLR